ncbi:MAG: 3-methyl-2-oxobutanoate dehydrogenase subunit beta [Acidilobaceae archaeon]|nr:3-methyl-2-oxobutanoate dehydrogenase subunit beta [Acidilobaceae archaeon]MCX8165768.1 3-methyl-2-oxobutanoate dehydrogenase subunit beta [Acidilobaceae archaeon]MDW7974193.1 3-methyl-2-oxobutanoate dehydrogenase subunit beta [Sulfolobales archaeon]
MSLPRLAQGRNRGVMPGNPACAGCPHTIGLRVMGRVLGDKAVLVVPAGCTSIISGFYPRSSLSFPLLHVPFASAAAVASGLRASMDARGEEGVVVVWSGDGGAADIGLATLSGAAVRNEDILVVVSDNEAYMNTGIQASGTTPWKALTTTSPVLGKSEERKDIALLMLFHKAPYVATASVAYPIDFAEKLERALKVKGFKLIHLHSPCPPGWRFDAGKTVEVAKLAVETGAWILWEYMEGSFRISPQSKPFVQKERRKPLAEYLKLQGRFSHLRPEDVIEIEKKMEESWRLVVELEKFYSRS